MPCVGKEVTESVYRRERRSPERGPPSLGSTALDPPTISKHSFKMSGMVQSGKDLGTKSLKMGVQSWDPQGGKRKPTPVSCPLIPDLTLR